MVFGLPVNNVDQIFFVDRFVDQIYEIKSNIMMVSKIKILVKHKVYKDLVLFEYFSSDPGRIQTYNRWSRNPVRYSVAPRGLLFCKCIKHSLLLKLFFIKPTTAGAETCLPAGRSSALFSLTANGSLRHEAFCFIPIIVLRHWKLLFHRLFLPIVLRLVP